MASPAEQRQARFAAAFREGRLTDEATVALFPVRFRRHQDQFDVIRRDTGSTVRTAAEGAETIRLLQAGRTLGAAKQELARRHGCDPREVDITVLLDSLVQADFVLEIDGYPISASAPPPPGPLWTFVGTYIQMLGLLLARHAPLRVATLLLHLRVAPRYAYLLRRIRGNMRSAPALPSAADAIDRLARENYDNIARMYLERMFLTDLPPRRLERWLRERCDISGLDQLDRARAAGRGAILVGFHVGSYSLIPYLVASRGYPVTLLSGTATAEDSTINRRIAEIHAAGYDCPLTCVGGALGVRALARSARRGETAILLCDTGVAAADEGVEVPFLGRRLRATEGTAWLARRTGAPVLPVVITWRPDGSHHLSIEPEVRVASSHDDAGYVADLMSAIHSVLERQVLRTPGQWFKWKDLHEISSPFVEITEAEAGENYRLLPAVSAGNPLPTSATTAPPQATASSATPLASG